MPSGPTQPGRQCGGQQHGAEHVPLEVAPPGRSHPGQRRVVGTTRGDPAGVVDDHIHRARHRVGDLPGLVRIGQVGDQPPDR
jgi:hypothetical protein